MNPVRISRSVCPVSGPTRAGHRRAGFSLAELMIAIGIMGVGLTMAASLFPAAIKEHSRSSSDVLGMIIAQNGLAMGRASLTLDGSGTVSGITVGSALVDVTTAVKPDASRIYPVNEATTTRGFLLMARQKTSNKNDYILFAIAFIKSAVANTVQLQQITGLAINPGDTQFPITSVPAEHRTKLIGSPVIAPDGTFCKLAGIDGDNAMLDRALVASGDLAVNSVWVVVEKDGTSTYAGEKSPALGISVTRTALKKAAS